MFSYANCSARFAHCFYNIYHFFSVDSFELILFFVFSVTPQSCIIQRIKNFLCGKIIFLSKTASIELFKTGDSVKSGKNSKIPKKNTMELVKRNLCRSKHKYELKLKIKGTKRSKTQQIQNKHLDQNQETNKPNKVLLWFDDILEKHD